MRSILTAIALVMMSISVQAADTDKSQQAQYSYGLVGSYVDVEHIETYDYGSGPNQYEFVCNDERGWPLKDRRGAPICPDEGVVLKKRVD